MSRRNTAHFLWERSPFGTQFFFGMWVVIVGSQAIQGWKEGRCEASRDLAHLGAVVYRKDTRGRALYRRWYTSGEAY